MLQLCSALFYLKSGIQLSVNSAKWFSFCYSSSTG